MKRSHLIFLLFIAISPAAWGQNLSKSTIDTLKRSAKQLINQLQNKERELLDIKSIKQQKEARSIGGDLRRSLRQNLANKESTTQVVAITVPAAAEARPEIKKDIKKDTDKGSANNTNINPKPYIKPNAPNIKPKNEDVQDFWAEMNRKDLALINQQEATKEIEVVALRQALQLQTHINETQNLRQNNWIIAGSAIMGLMLFFVVFLVRTNTIRKKNNKLLIAEKQLTEQERDKSEALLLNILPLAIAKELKASGKAQPRQYKMASSMFTDFKGFTSVAEKMSPTELIGELDDCFAKFDEIITKHNLEKIKTIGDAYMCVGGIPEANQTNPVNAVLAGLEIQAFMQEKHHERLSQGKEYWHLRLGINTGEVVAGVVGKKKFAYDVWGDSVNTASRMESSGEVGKVNISGNTYKLVHSLFVCTHRGRVEAKNKGAIDMYFVESIVPELSENGAGRIPNEHFWEKAKELHSNT